MSPNRSSSASRNESELPEKLMTEKTPLRIILAQPRGFCAGVVRAIEIVERALQKYGAPVYVRHEIVHNKHVVDSLKAKGARFVETVSEVPENAVTIFSAHGVAKSVEEEAAGRGLPVLNATCPLVTKVHNQGKRYVAQGRTLILIGHAGHPEVEGTIGQISGPVVLVQTEEDVDKLDIPADKPVAYITQTTLSVDDTRGIIAALQRHRRSRNAGHLLRHAKSSGGRARTQPAGRRYPGGRREKQLEFQPPARDRAGDRHSELSDRRQQ
jgi:(E)-4-hydroxy-3-methyl-but-2-enyl pyrophosphate reductase